jgi:hypothetical protein
MDIKQAIKTLGELIGKQPIAKPGYLPGDPVRVVSLDLVGPRAGRCVVGPIGHYRSHLWAHRPVSDISAERKYQEADAVVTAASVHELPSADWPPTEQIAMCGKDIDHVQ